MKIFISDLHLGDGSRTDDFHHEGQFLKIENKPILGDKSLQYMKKQELNIRIT